MGLWSGLFIDGSFSSPDILLGPGEFDESRVYMAHHGYFDLSRLKFHAEPGYESSIIDKIQQETPDTIDEEQTTYIDIVIFPLPVICSTQPHCDLARLGVGKVEAFHGTSFLSLCHEGRLDIQDDFYEGYHGSIPVPMQGRMPKHIENGKFYVKASSQDYAIIITNCNDQGRAVSVKGELMIEYGEKSANTTPQYLNPKYMATSLLVFLLLLHRFVRIRWATEQPPPRAYTSYHPVAVVPDIPDGNSPEDRNVADVPVLT
jgi:hypothetical protein